MPNRPRSRSLPLVVGAAASIVGAACLQAWAQDVAEASGEAETAMPADPAPPEEDAAAPAEAEEAVAVADPTVPMTLWFGIFPLHVGDLDLRRGTANVTYYVWTRWAGSSSGTAYELSNGNVESAEHEYLSEEGGVHYAYYRCRSEVQLDLDFHDFPFDDQWVAIEYEHAEEGSSTVVLAVDEDSLRHVESPEVSGWMVDAPIYDVVEHEYRTNWGMPGADPEEISNFPRVRMRIRLHHDVSATFFKTFLTLFISVLIAFLAFFLAPQELEARVGLGVAGIFGSVTSHSVVASNLPEIPYMTLSDKIHLAGMMCVFVALLETALAGWLVLQSRSAAAVKVDRVARVVMPLGYGAVITFFILGR